MGLLVDFAKARFTGIESRDSSWGLDLRSGGFHYGNAGELVFFRCIRPLRAVAWAWLPWFERRGAPLLRDDFLLCGGAFNRRILLLTASI